MKLKLNATLSPRGQLTLPSSLRAKLGLGGGSTVTLEEQNGVIVLRPAAVLEYEMYTDDRLKEFSKLDKLTDDLRRDVEKLRSKRSAKTASR